MSARIVLHGELLELSAPGNRAKAASYPVERRGSIKDVIEALGPPHTEVGRIAVDCEEKDFSFIPADGDEVCVYPVRPPLDVTRPTRLRPDALPRLAFAVDVNVGKLAPLLRLLGYDAAYQADWSDEDLARLVRDERRVLLTRDRNLLKRGQVEFGRLVRAGEPTAQLKEVLDFFGQRGPFEPFRRCLRCNVPLEPVAKADVLHLLQPLTRKYFDEFSSCPLCRRVYWAGSHHDRMVELLESLDLERLAPEGRERAERPGGRRQEERQDERPGEEGDEQPDR